MYAISLGDVLHFALELCAFGALGVWGFQTGENGLGRAALGIGVPLAAAVLWGVFRVPNDPGPATVAVPGWLRLILELGILGLSVWAVFRMHQNGLAFAFAVAILIDYLLMIKRILWLFNP
ncbi:hypothetical protein LARV_01676 [Longilinea arvoryzae]|uniref:DUF2568 domain-containing protein n=2 Tax=Longilinea arvoryzae TaxID=360412 RepID=A0A0S7BEE8_9CHLR|nr:hypothetical protein LARV_01676 [Longilinea arvoryzae]